MFGNLFKKKVKEAPVELQKIELSDEDKRDLEDRVATIKTELKESNGDKKIQLLNEWGAIEEKLNDLDLAIDYFEQSLDEKEQFGDAYNALLRLYEEKRKAAAYDKDDDGIQKWVTKIDGLMAISKRVLKSNY